MKKLGWRVSRRMNVPILFSNDSFGSANSFEKEWRGEMKEDEEVASKGTIKTITRTMKRTMM